MANMQRTSNDGDTASELALAHNNPDLVEMIAELAIIKKKCSVCKVRKLEARKNIACVSKILPLFECTR